VGILILNTREESKRNFDLAMEQEQRYMRDEYACLDRQDFHGAEAAHNMRWKMMDKAVSFLVPADNPA
jgi:hypothetical protein